MNFNADLDGDTLTDLRPLNQQWQYIRGGYRDRYGRIRTRQYPHCITQTLHNEARRYGPTMFFDLDDTPMRPVVRARLKKLERYRERVQ